MKIHHPGAAIDAYRDQTARQASMPGAMAPSFRCARCQGIRLTTGRKRAVPGCSRAGWVCAQCAAERRAA